ncbi:MAG: hypothetical protein AAF907_07655, partial [Planctomycetota bacterium]
GAEDEPSEATAVAGGAGSEGDGTGGGMTDPDAGAAPALVDVLVDGGEYLVVQGYSADGLPRRRGLSLSAVLDLAGRVAGQDGVKVRVSRTPDAIAGAVSDLMDNLRSAGLEEDEIDYRTRLVEDGI